MIKKFKLVLGGIALMFLLGTAISAYFDVLGPKTEEDASYISGVVVQISPDDRYFTINPVKDMEKPYTSIKELKISMEVSGGIPCPDLHIGDGVKLLMTKPERTDTPIIAEEIECTGTMIDPNTIG